MKIEARDDGTVWRDGRRIGEIRDNTVWLEGKVGAAVKAAIRKAAGRRELGFAVAAATATATGTPAQVPTFKPNNKNGTAPSGGVDDQALLTQKPELEPVQDPMMGCKDPVWLAWRARSGTATH